jgi:hypothetical protein
LEATFDDTQPGRCDHLVAYPVHDRDHHDLNGSMSYHRDLHWDRKHHTSGSPGDSSQVAIYEASYVAAGGQATGYGRDIYFHLDHSAQAVHHFVVRNHMKAPDKTVEQVARHSPALRA